MPNLGQRNSDKRSGLRIIRSSAFILILLFLIWSAGRVGYASLLSTYAARSLRLDAADAAVSLSADAQNHLIRGGVHQAQGNFSGAMADYSRAAMLRPDDYVIWLNVAHARELNGDKEGAIAAASRAVVLAPHYAKPHWQLGNLWLRAGRTEGAYSELRLAGSRNPTLLPAFIDLVWQLSSGNVQAVLAAIDPRSAETYKALADYFRKRGKATEAIAMFRAAGYEAGEEVAAQRRAYLAELLTAKQFKLAHELWSIAHPPAPDGPTMFDPGFEDESDLDEPGFGWRAAEKSGEVILSLDSSDPGSGRLSLKVSFNGASEPGQALVSQLVQVVPRTRYRLRFAARTSEILSGTLPSIVVMDEGAGQSLGQSDPLPQTTDTWRDYQLEFITSDNTEAIRISLQRKPCSAPCPIFGRLWLDSFSLQPV
ncbi:MAG TPA: hypothetical protein VNO50_07825 [Pyrinomonadaceae bacterium]|nr:hypothetical protein [Pyrinomonadaceae bacterium]